MTQPLERSVSTELVAVTDGQPRVLTTNDERTLPAGPFELSHRSLQAGLRAWVEAQTHHPIAYVEQLYTFADSDRSDALGSRVISVSYLALTREAATRVAQGGWQDWYRYFPWEDRRQGPCALVEERIVPHLRAWAATFGLDGAVWNEDLVLQRYELLYEAGLVKESRHTSSSALLLGDAMHHDHRRILATVMARLRAMIKYRPVAFELMPPTFTLLQLKVAVEALAGRDLHKRNFRRLIEQQALVEETGELTSGAAGRPAKLFRFRGDVFLERAISGSKLLLSRQA